MSQATEIMDNFSGYIQTFQPQIDIIREELGQTKAYTVGLEEQISILQSNDQKCRENMQNLHEQLSQMAKDNEAMKIKLEQFMTPHPPTISKKRHFFSRN